MADYRSYFGGMNAGGKDEDVEGGGKGGGGGKIKSFKFILSIVYSIRGQIIAQIWGVERWGKDEDPGGVRGTRGRVLNCTLATKDN